jgi:putative phage-type endonuclease
MNQIELYIWSYLKKNIQPNSEHWNHDLPFSYDDYIQRLDFINRSRYQLKILKKNKGIKQKSDEWYEIRKDMLTASNTYEGVRCYNSLIRKKALKISDNISSNPALEWGILFEPIACKIYSILNNRIKIHEFGLIQYDEFKNYGASPDGISDIGIMLEIKCPYSRIIKEGEIPIKYYYQMQGQMAVCNLEECDYAEFNFVEIDLDEFLSLSRKDLCGIITKYEDDTVEYSRLKEEPNISYMENTSLKEKKRVIYWKLENHHIQRVKFNKNKWYDEYLPKIKEFWNKVIEYEEPKYTYIEDDD